MLDVPREQNPADRRQTREQHQRQTDSIRCEVKFQAKRWNPRHFGDGQNFTRLELYKPSQRHEQSRRRRGHGDLARRRGVPLWQEHQHQHAEK